VIGNQFIHPPRERASKRAAAPRISRIVGIVLAMEAAVSGGGRESDGIPSGGPAGERA
jgi:hypothetical protein